MGKTIYFYPNERWTEKHSDRTLVFELNWTGELFLIGSVSLQTAIDIHGVRPFLTREQYVRWNNGHIKETA